MSERTPNEPPGSDPAPGDALSLDALHDILVPDPVGLWPVAPGWIAVAVVLAMVAAGWCWRAWLRYRRDAYRRVALAELRGLDPEHMDGLSVLLKRAALDAFPREHVASLSGPAWWRFLDDSAGTRLFSERLGALLDTLAYGDAELLNGQDRGDLLEGAAFWVRRHRRTDA